MSRSGRSAVLDAGSRKPFSTAHGTSHDARPAGCRLPRHHRAALWSFVTTGQAGGRRWNGANILSVGVGLPPGGAQHSRAATPHIGRQAPTTITARDFDHFMRVPPNGTLQRGNSQAARLYRRSRPRAGPPRNCFREAATMLLFPGRGLENYDASIIRPGCGGRHVCWPMRAAGSRQLQHRSSTRTERPASPSFTNSIRRHRETEYTTRSTLHLSGRHRYAQAYNNGKAAPASVSPPMAVHYTVIYGPDVCLTLFDAMQMAPGRGQKRRPRQVGTDGTILQRYSARSYSQRLCSPSQKPSSARMRRP